MKNVFTIAPNVPFLETLATSLWEKTNGDGFQLSKHLILLPTQRARRLLGTAFARVANGKPVLLPRMQALGDVDEDEIAFADASFTDQKPAIAPLKRLMLLTQMVQQRNPSLSCDQAARAADALAKLLDQIEIEGCDIARLPKLVEEREYAEHWQQTVDFLEIVTRHWPKILGSLGCQDPAERRNAVMKAQADLWLQCPPTFPVIAAGSTGSIPSTAYLLDAIASVPQGALILPGLDRDLDDDSWEDIDETHPQYSMKKLLERMKITRKDIKSYGPTHTPSPRVGWLNEAMRPANFTERWRELRGKISADAISGVTSLTTEHSQEEAQVIALRLRQQLEMPDKTAIFVTADRKLAARVAVLLRRWGIEVDDSGGAPLSSLPPGAFLNLVLAASTPHAAHNDLLALLKHPLAAFGLPIAACRAKAREAEVALRRSETDNLAEFRKRLEPLTESWNKPLPLEQRLALHVAIAERVAATDTESGAERLYSYESGNDTAEWLDEWKTAAEDFPSISGNDYAALFASLSSTKNLRPTQAKHPRLAILGTLEARLMHADLVIIGGLNEGTWPPDAGFDPWMSRPMRKNFGLPAPEYRIGLSAHDFVQLASLPEVMLTRAARSGGAPTVPSRFLLQIEAVLNAAGFPDKVLEPKEPWRTWAKVLDEPTEVTPCSAPEPKPPLDVRPHMLSVTDIGKWMRNPYYIYARHILKLKPLEELDAELDASDRGNMIHGILERFATRYPHDELPPDAENQLMLLACEAFAQDNGDPRVRAFWQTRFADIAAWILEQESARREKDLCIHPEATGSRTLKSLTLLGRADRIDELPSGALSIIDYKTGSKPSEKEVAAGLEPQLQLLAWIAQSGGFKSIEHRKVESVHYWWLSGGQRDCKDIVFGDDKLSDLITQAEIGLEKLIDAYTNSDMPYRAAPRRSAQPRHNDYAHLSRMAEWGRTRSE